jgi:hypothetical protein
MAVLKTAFWKFYFLYGNSKIYTSRASCLLTIPKRLWDYKRSFVLWTNRVRAVGAWDEEGCSSLGNEGSAIAGWQFYFFIPKICSFTEKPEFLFH